MCSAILRLIQYSAKVKLKGSNPLSHLGLTSHSSVGESPGLISRRPWQGKARVRVPLGQFAGIAQW